MDTDLNNKRNEGGTKNRKRKLNCREKAQKAHKLSVKAEGGKAESTTPFVPAHGPGGARTTARESLNREILKIREKSHGRFDRR
jgi:hypothetical protein